MNDNLFHVDKYIVTCIRTYKYIYKIDTCAKKMKIVNKLNSTHTLIKINKMVKT